MSKPITIYTVSSFDDEHDCGYDRCVIGSYRTSERAAEECANYITERINLNWRVASAAANDENHPEAAQFLEKTSDGDYAIPDPIAFRHFLLDELSGARCYYIWDGEDSYHFDIDENDLVD